MKIRFGTIVVIALLAAGGLSAVLPYPSPREPPSASPKVKLQNPELRNQDGAAVRFASDIAGDRIIALNFIYTDCSTACPVASAIFAKLQSRLGDKLTRDVRMVSLSINPATDTPARLKAYAERFHATPEWVWLTGEKTHVDALLKGLGVYNRDYTNHAAVILVGDPARGVWTRFNGLSSPDAIAARIDELLLARDAKS
ncbi:SCO family protein [Methylomicrobium lacus]|uniref:SCO family protein n=1 Tax=Methylomicrobium lacus TaxID=136992 RepID=UPI00045E664C|nr:SCO family protein [Methylomicrobium lacus]